MKTRLIVSSAVLALLPVVAAAGHGAPLHRGGFPPPTTVTVEVDGEVLTLGPYATSDFATPSDPVNLVFLHADPRAIRQELMKLSGDRTVAPLPGVPVFPPDPPFNCRWTDAMGYEQAAFAKPEGWVGGEVQLACVNPAAPMGDPFRFHLRLFRSGPHTFGAAHFEILIPNSAEHEVLSWDFARTLVEFDMLRTRTLTVLPPKHVEIVPPGTFRSVRRLIYQGIMDRDGGPTLLTILGLLPEPPGSTPEAVAIPTDGKAVAFTSIITFDPVKSDRRTKYRATYALNAPKPFCGPGFVRLEGTLQMELRVQTNPSGKYERTYGVSGTLSVTPLGATGPIGPPVPAIIFEAHRGMITDNYGEVTERASQTLLGDPVQFKAWTFGAGQRDYFWGQVSCGLP